MAELAATTGTVEEFLPWDDGSNRRHALIDGRIVALAQPSEARATILSNPTIQIGNRRWPPCRVLRVRLPHRDDAFDRFDLAVSRAPAEAARRHIAETARIVEIRSPSTARHDRGRKLDHDRQLPSLKEVSLIIATPPAVCTRPSG